MSSAAKLCRKQIEKLIPYASARRIGGEGNLWINANEAPDSPDFQYSAGHLNRYPEFQPPSLLKSYSDYCQQPEENILITRGADEGIELLMRTFCEPNQDCIAFCPPTYGMYAISAETCGVAAQTISLKTDFSLTESLFNQLDSTCKLLFLCHPNNPTGTLISIQVLETLLTATKDKVLIVVDEAYIEFSPNNTVSQLISQYDNLVVIRTLSKAFGLAALRCGFVLACKDIIQRLQKVIAPYPVPGPVADIATQALSPKGILEMHQRVKRINNAKQEFINTVSTISEIKEVLPSKGNFVTIRFYNADNVWQQLQKADIIARAVSHYLYLDNCIRFSIGSEAEMQQVAKVLGQSTT